MRETSYESKTAVLTEQKSRVADGSISFPLHDRLRGRADLRRETVHHDNDRWSADARAHPGLDSLEGTVQKGLDVFGPVRHTGQRDLDAAKNAAAQSLKASKAETKDTLRLKLRQSQMNKEVLTLQLRDGLRARIGEDAFNRLLSYARINIAPTIKVGKIAVPK